MDMKQKGLLFGGIGLLAIGYAGIGPLGPYSYVGVWRNDPSWNLQVTLLLKPDGSFEYHVNPGATTKMTASRLGRGTWHKGVSWIDLDVEPVATVGWSQNRQVPVSTERLSARFGRLDWQEAPGLTFVLHKTPEPPDSSIFSAPKRTLIAAPMRFSRKYWRNQEQLRRSVK